jgi:hypothetical protein
MGETQALEGFWASIGHASWAVVLGYAMVAICIGFKGLTEGKLHGAVKSWAGAITGMLIGVGSSMALDSDWIHAVVFGVLVGGASTGFWQMVKSTIPDLGKPSSPPPAGPTVPTLLSTLLAGVFIIWVLLGSGCAARQAQVATQTSLTGLAELVDAGDEALATAIPGLTEDAIERARDRCSTSCPDPLALYADEVAPLDRAVDGLEVVAASLRVAQGAQDTWVSTGALPDTAPLCLALGDAVDAMPGLLDECGVDLPPGLDGAGAIVTTVCAAWAAWRQR